MDNKAPRTKNKTSSFFFNSASNEFKKQFTDLFEKMKNSSEIIEKRNNFEKTCAYILSTYGWYITPVMKYKNVSEIFTDIQNHNIKKVEKKLLNPNSLQ